MSAYGAVADHSEYRAAWFFCEFVEEHLQLTIAELASLYGRMGRQDILAECWTCLDLLTTQPDPIWFYPAGRLCYALFVCLNKIPNLHQDPEADQGGATLVAGSLMDKIFGRRSLESRTNSFRSACFASQRSAK